MNKTLVLSPTTKSRLEELLARVIATQPKPAVKIVQFPATKQEEPR